jgi:hypothetical protein
MRVGVNNTSKRDPSCETFRLNSTTLSGPLIRHAGLSITTLCIDYLSGEETRNKKQETRKKKEKKKKEKE